MYEFTKILLAYLKCCQNCEQKPATMNVCDSSEQK